MASTVSTQQAASSAAVKGKRGLKALQKEFINVKEKFNDAVKVFTAKQQGDGPSKPWPISIQATLTPSKDAQNFDVSNLILKFCIDDKFDPDFEEKLPVHVEAPSSNELPGILLEKIVKTVEQQWKEELIKQGSSGGWQLVNIIKWCEKNFLKLIRLMPELIEHYIGCDSEGASQRRFTIVAPAQKPKGDVAPAEVTEEEAEKAAAFYAQKELERLKKEADELQRKKQEGEVIRAMYEAGKLHAPPPKLSKKEEAEKRKSKQGVRLAKTAPKARPYEGEGAKERRKGKTNT